MKVYMKKEHEIFVENNKERIEEWIVIWNVINPVKTPMGDRKVRGYEQIEIQTLLEPRDDTPAKSKREYKKCQLKWKPWGRMITARGLDGLWS